MNRICCALLSQIDNPSKSDGSKVIGAGDLAYCRPKVLANASASVGLAQSGRVLNQQMPLREQTGYGEAGDAGLAQYNRIELLMYLAKQLAGGHNVRRWGHVNISLVRSTEKRIVRFQRCWRATI